MRLLYLDCFAGIAGDMTLAALIDLGADPAYIAEELRKLPIDPFSMDTTRVVKQGISSRLLKLEIGGGGENPAARGHDHDHDGYHHHEHSHDHDHDAHHHHEHGHDHDHDGHHHHEHGHDHDHDKHQHAHSHDHDHGHHHHEHSHDHDHHHRRASDILRMIEQSALPARVKERSIAIFKLIAVAEGRVHGVSPETVHFHEVGAMDSIIDIIGVCLALEQLDVDVCMAAPVPVGHGRIRIAHGVYPVPAPAVAELLKDVPLADFSAKGELTTPTGAGILKALAVRFGPIPAGKMTGIGYGAGRKDFEHPNVLRAILMDVEDAPRPIGPSAAHDALRERIAILEAQVDDMTGEAAGFAMERLFEAGALDVYLTPVYMKKNRPATLITVLCAEPSAGRLEAVLLRETTTLGVRSRTADRTALRRNIVEAQTPYGTVRVKQAIMNGAVIREMPEFEDAAARARASGVPLADVMNAAISRENR